MLEKGPKMLGSVGDRKPDEEILPDGTKILSIRVRRSNVDSVGLIGKRDLKDKVEEYEKWQEKCKGRKVADWPSTAAVFGSPVDYKLMMGDVGSRESIEMEPEPPLEMVFIRHLKHEDNIVAPETKDAFIPRAEKIVDELNLTSDDEVYVVSSPVGQYLGNEKVSRTESTADVIKTVLRSRGIDFADDIDSDDGNHGSVDVALSKALREFEIADLDLFVEAIQKARANMAAKKEGRELPHPEAPSQVPAVYASYSDGLIDLIDKTGIIEVSSATIARSLKGVDMLEDYFLKGNGKSNKRKVVIMAGHGQFITDITEAFQRSTDHKFPVIYADNGAYFTISAGVDSQNRLVEEYSFKTPPKIEKK